MTSHDASEAPSARNRVKPPVTPEAIAAWKDLLWVVVSWGFVFAFLIASLWLALKMYSPQDTFDQTLKLFATAIGVPAFVAVAVYEKISSEMIAMLLGAIIGLAVGAHIMP